MAGNGAADLSNLKGVLLMAYGTPRNLDEVEPYYRDVRGGRPVSPEAVDELKDRYRAVGGRTPLLEITRSTASSLEQRLNRDGVNGSWRAYIGMKHWHPYVAEAIEDIRADGVDELVSLVLAPHYSGMSIAQYRERVECSLEGLEPAPPTRIIESWHGNPVFVRFIARRITDKLARLGLGADSGVEVLFTAHSLPTTILEHGDPYPEELMESARAVAAAAGVGSWRFAYQSAGKTGMSWLGPDILDSIEEIAREGRKNILVVPFGFVCDHLEILFDVDIEAIEAATALGVELARIEMPNDSPGFIDALFDVVTSGAGARSVDLTA